MYNKESLLDTFVELLGYSKTKPFECIGTYEEVRLAVSLAIQKYDGELPYLLNYYFEHYPLEKNTTILYNYNKDNNLTDKFERVIKGAIEKYEKWYYKISNR